MTHAVNNTDPDRLDEADAWASRSAELGAAGKIAASTSRIRKTD